VIPHLCRTKNGKAQLRALGLQKGELLELLLVLPLRLLLPPLGISHRIGQAMRVLLGHLLIPTCLRKLTLKKGNLSNKAFYLVVSKS
jgi:hypothetical protein